MPNVIESTIDKPEPSQLVPTISNVTLIWDSCRDRWMLSVHSPGTGPMHHIITPLPQEANAVLTGVSGHLSHLRHEACKLVFEAEERHIAQQTSGMAKQ